MTERKRRILVVDDDRSQRVSTRLVLGHAGYDVVTAADGHEAIALVREGSFDLVIMDVRMPGIDGVETLRTMRETGDVPAILVTAYAVEDALTKGREAGAAEVLVKPVEVSVLLSTVARHSRREPG